MTSKVSAGERFGKLTAKRELIPNRLWLCKCDCGAWKITRPQHLQYGLVKSCGCLPREHTNITPPRKLPEYMYCPIGMRFGKLTPVSRISKSRWLCKCDCGGEIVATNEGLYRGKVTHCENCEA